MKRSAINAALRDAQATLAAQRWALPGWAGWSLDDHAAHPDQSAFLARRQLGWDVTDFGSGDFAARGLVLFCVRNGMQGDPAERPYAEKLLFVGVGQETPFHCHKVKLEDIIVRGGGTLVVEFTPESSFEASAPVWVDGRQVAPFAGPLRLTAGESVTIPRGLMHRFYGEGAPVFVAEVSQCNDDLNDNFFLEPLGRFSEVEEDEPALYPLWNEVGRT